MTLSQLIIGWFYYGIVFMGLSVLATFLLNKVTTKRWLPPLIINAVAILLLLGLAAKGLVPPNLDLRTLRPRPELKPRV